MFLSPLLANYFAMDLFLNKAGRKYHSIPPQPSYMGTPASKAPNTVDKKRRLLSYHQHDVEVHLHRSPDPT